MPYSDQEKNARLKRNYKRNKKHGPWRHIIDWYNGLCAQCGEIFDGDFHEPFGEDYFNTGKMQIRIPLCLVCHSQEHLDLGWAPFRRLKSKCLEDIGAEIIECGGYAQWRRKYRIPEGPPFMQGNLFQHLDV